MGKLWIGEAHGFTEWLRLIRRPAELRSAAIDFCDLAPQTLKAILAKFGLPVVAGMDLSELESLMGPPEKAEQLVGDRRSYLFRYGKPDKYFVDCTVRDVDGLVYVVVMVPDYETV